MYKLFFKAGLIVLSVIFLTAGCTGKIGKTKEELLREGVRQIAENNPRGAIVFFKNALESDQNFFEARFQLAKAYYRIGNFDSAEKELQKTIRQSPALGAARILLARVYLQKAKPDDALHTIAELQGNSTGNAELLEIEGWARALKGELPAAVDFLKQAVASRGSKPSAAILLSRVYAKMGRPDTAREEVEEVLRKEPSNADALYLLAGFQAGGGDPDAAIKTYERIIRAQPSDAEAYFKKGMLHIRKQQLDEALALAEKLIATLPDKPQGYELKGIVLFHRKNFNDAVTSLQKSLAIMPNISGYYYLGLSHYYRNESEQAMSQFQRALDLNPSFVQARVLVSLILLKQKRTDDSIAEIRKALEADKDNAFAHNILGSAYMEKGKYNEGMAEFNRAISLDPKLADVHLKKGFYSFSKGRFRDAEAELKTAVRLTPEALNTRLFLASYYLKLKDYDKAIHTMQEGLANNRSDAVLYNYMAVAFLAGRRPAEAVKCIQKAKAVNPDYLDPYFNLAAYYIKSGDHDKAANEYKAVLGRAPKDLRALISLASVLEFKGQDKDALAYYKKAGESGLPAGAIALADYFIRKREGGKALEALDDAIKADPRNAELMELKGKTCLAEKKYKDAAQSFEKLETVDPERAFPLIVKTAVIQRDYKTALRKVEEKLKSDAARNDLISEQAEIYLLMGNAPKALESANTIIRQNPGSAFGYMVLAYVYENSNNRDKAIDALRRGLKVERDRSRASRAGMMLAGLYERKNNYPLALSVYDGILRADPGNVAALFAQGELYSRTGRKRDAVKKYLQVIWKSENHVPALNNLAYLYAEGYGSKSEALKLAAKAYSLAPGNGGIADTLGYVLLKNGRPDEARKMFERAVAFLPNNPSVYYHIALSQVSRGERAGAVYNLQRAAGLGAFPEVDEARRLLAELKKR